MGEKFNSNCAKQYYCHLFLRIHHEKFQFFKRTCLQLFQLITNILSFNLTHKVNNVGKNEHFQQQKSDL